MDVRDLDRSSVEVEVHDVTIDGHDDKQIDDDQEEPSQASRQAVVVTPKDAIGMEKCIVFTEHIMSLLLQLHGKRCVDQDVKGIMFTKKHMLELAWLFPGNVVLAIWVEDGLPNQPVTI